MNKKILLVSYINSWRGVWNWETLKLWQTKKDLARFYERPVDLLTAAEMADLNYILANYDTIILYALDDLSYTANPYRLILLDILKRFVGLKRCLNMAELPDQGHSVEDRKILQDYFYNPIDEDFFNFTSRGNHIVFGSEVALNLWDEGTFIKVQDSFDFRSYKLYDTATVFFQAYGYDTYTEMFQLLENLRNRILQIHAKEKILMLPLDYGLYQDDFISTMISWGDKFSNITIHEAQDLIGNNLWRYSLWDYKNDIKKETTNYVPFT